MLFNFFKLKLILLNNKNNYKIDQLFRLTVFAILICFYPAVHLNKVVHTKICFSEIMLNWCALFYVTIKTRRRPIIDRHGVGLIRPKPRDLPEFVFINHICNPKSSPNLNARSDPCPNPNSIVYIFSIVFLIG